MKRGALLFVCSFLSVPIAAFADAGAPMRSGQTIPGITFAIAPQSLSTALIAFGKQANVQVLTAGGTIAIFRSDGVSGTLSPDAALARLLHGTGLAYSFVDAGTVVVKPSASEPAEHSPAQTASSHPNVDDAKLLAPIHATALIAQDTGFMADTSNSATRTESDPLDVPQSISIVTHDLMDSQQGRTVADAVRNVPGVQYTDGSDSLPSFQIRGFNPGNGMTDGMPNSISALGDFPPLIGVTRVEVLKGPETILGDSIGNSDFGGLINVILKKPQSEPVHELSYNIGKFGDTQAGLDLAGPLGNSQQLSYRLVLSSEYADRTAQGYRGLRSNYFAPSIGWQNDTTKLVVGGSRVLNRLPIPDHTVLLDDSVASSSPPGLLLGNPGDNSTYQTSRLYYMFEHQFGDGWTFRSRGQYVRQSTHQQGWYFSYLTPSGDTDAAATVHSAADAYYTLQNDLTNTFTQGPLTHTIVVGFDYSRSQVGSIDDYFSSVDMPYNIFTGGRLPPASSAVLPDSNEHTPGSAWSGESGIFLQDQIALGEHVDVLLALRRSAYPLATTDVDGNPLNLRKTKWVPNFGLVYKLRPDMALYGSISKGFQPDTLLGKNGRPLAPSLSRQVEIGTKLDLFQGRARLTASWYRITLDRSYDLNSVQPLYFYYVPGPGQVNKGVEIEFTGQVAPGLDMTTSYTNASISNQDGTLSTGSPRQHFNLWTSYRFQRSWLQGWAVAGGILARSRSLGLTVYDSTYFNIPGQASVDANVSYRASHWSATLGVKNLFDRKLLSDDFNETFVPLRDRRTFLLSGTYDF